MTLNNFNPSKEQMARAKVLQSHELRNILEEMEGGNVIVVNCTDQIRQAQMADCYKEGSSWNLIHSVRIRNILTLERAGLIYRTEFDDYIEYRLTYDPKITSIKDVK